MRWDVQVAKRISYKSQSCQHGVSCARVAETPGVSLSTISLKAPGTNQAETTQVHSGGPRSLLGLLTKHERGNPTGLCMVLPTDLCMVLPTDLCVVLPQHTVPGKPLPTWDDGFLLAVALATPPPYTSVPPLRPPEINTELQTVNLAGMILLQGRLC